MKRLFDYINEKIQTECEQFYNEKKYKDCAKKAFEIVRSEYMKKFGTDNIPSDFLETYYIYGGVGNSENKYKDFQIGCARILRSINNFRNDIEHH